MQKYFYVYGWDLQNTAIVKHIEIEINHISL